MSLMSGSHCWYLFHKQEQRLYDLVYILTIWDPSMKAVSSNAPSGWTARFSRAMIGFFWKSEWKPTWWHQCHFLLRQVSFCLHVYSLWPIQTRIVNKNANEMIWGWPRNRANHCIMKFWIIKNIFNHNRRKRWALLQIRWWQLFKTLNSFRIHARMRLIRYGQ